MPLTVNCQCGAKVVAPEDSSLTRVNCSNCGAVIFLAGLTESGDEPDTYGIAAGEEIEPADAAPPAAVEPDPTVRLGRPCWFDRYKASPESRKGERAKMVEVIAQVGSAATATDPFATALYRAATIPDSETALAEVARVATSGHPVYAPIAITFLEYVGPSEAKAAGTVLRLLGESRDPQAQAILVQCLQRIGPTPVVHVRDLIAALSGPSSAVYPWAVQCLALLGPAAKKGVEALFKTLKINQLELRLVIIEALGAIAREPDRVVPLLIQALKHQSPEYRRRGAVALGRFGPAAAPALPLLNAALKDASPPVREAAAAALKTLGTSPPAAAPPAPAGQAAPASILVQCACGKRLRIKGELAGKKVKCPSCAGVVAVPLASTIPDEKTCPTCLASVPNAAVLCVHCGIDFRTGKRFTPGMDGTGAGGASPAGKA